MSLGWIGDSRRAYPAWAVSLPPIPRTTFGIASTAAATSLSSLRCFARSRCCKTGLGFPDPWRTGSKPSMCSRLKPPCRLSSFSVSSRVLRHASSAWTRCVDPQLAVDSFGFSAHSLAVGLCLPEGVRASLPVSRRTPLTRFASGLPHLSSSRPLSPTVSISAQVVLQTSSSSLHQHCSTSPPFPRDCLSDLSVIKHR